MSWTKNQARWAVQNAVRDGKMPRAWSLPCADCSVMASEYDHHKGYEFEHRLDVQPVCQPCHKLRGIMRGENPHGMRHHQGKLDPPRVRGIRALFALGCFSQSELGRLYGVTQGTIHDVVTNYIWKRVTP